eukprot:165362-Lingulodinium_polyedra.AAC.1
MVHVSEDGAIRHGPEPVELPADDESSSPTFTPPGSPEEEARDLPSAPAHPEAEPAPQKATRTHR